MTDTEYESIEELLDDTVRAMKQHDNVEKVLDSALNQTKLDNCCFSKSDILALAEHIVFGLYDGQFPETDNCPFSGPSMVLFTQRMQIEELYLDWCEEYDVANKPNSMVAFMQGNNWLNEEQIMADLKLMDVFKKKE